MSRIHDLQSSLLLIFLLTLFVLPGVVGAQEGSIWPIRAQLVRNHDDMVEVWTGVGDVSIWNTHEDLKISVAVDGGYRMAKVGFHIVFDPSEFEAILDSKGKPKFNRLDSVTDYAADEGGAVASHLEIVDLRDLDPCWSIKPEICPPDRYVLVAVELQGVAERAYAANPGVFDRFTPEDDGVYWGYYVTYPLAKVEPGHFVDANVNGLNYRTITQEGLTGANGQYWFLPDERISFSVGALPLGSMPSDRRVTPVDLFPDAADFDDGRVLNVARLLQSFDGDGNPAQGAINITPAVTGCLNGVLADVGSLPPPEDFFANDALVESIIEATIQACTGQVALTAVSKEEALANLGNGMQSANVLKRNVSKAPDLEVDKAKIELVPMYVPAQRPDGSRVDVPYYDADGHLIELRDEAKPIVVAYLGEVAGTGTMDVFVATSLDDGDSWKRRNVSKTAGRSSLLGFPGKSEKPMLKVKDDKIFVAWTDKYCRGGRPGYAITVCADDDGDGTPDPCQICRDTAEGTLCTVDYPGDDDYWRDDLFGIGGPQRSVIYEDYPELGEVPYSCVWTSRAIVEPDGSIQWFKPERVTSGRRDAYQLFAGAGEDVAFGIVWQEDPKGLIPGDAAGPGEGWSGANTHNKTDIWYSFITLNDFGKVDWSYPAGGHGDGDIVDSDPELGNRVKALVPMSLPVRLTDNEVCSAENIDPNGGHGDHDFDGEGEGTHRYCGTLEGIGTAEAPGSNPLCAYTFAKSNPQGEVHHVCVTADERLLDGNTGASRPGLFLQPYKRPDGTKSAWAIVGYEESKGVGTPPDGEHDDEPCGTDDGTDDHDDDRYKPDMGKNVIYHSFDFAQPETVAGGGILNLPETDALGNAVYLVDEFGELLLDWKGEPQLAYENARRVRFVTQPPSKATGSGTILVALYRQGEEGSGKPADIFLRRLKKASGNPYSFDHFLPGAQNLSSVQPTMLFQDPFDSEKPVKMLRWGWSAANLADSSAANPFTDARAHRGALNGDELLIGYTWTPNWGRKANDKYDFFVRRSFNGGTTWTTDPTAFEPIEHNVVFRVPIIENGEVTWGEEVVTTTYQPGAPEPPRNVSNLRNNRTSVLEPRLVKTPGTITDPWGNPTGYPEDVQQPSAYQLAYGLEFNQNTLPVGVTYPQIPLDIYYSRTQDKGQHYESVTVTPQGGSGRPQEGWQPLAREPSEEGAVQLRQTPAGSRMYAVWLEKGEGGTDVMFRRVDYR